MKKTTRFGFTLVELLVVIGIIAVLIALLLPVLNKARTQAAAISCSARMRQLTVAVNLYVNAYKGYLPPIALQGSGFTGSSALGRPDIFPAGGEGYLTPFLQAKYTTTSVQSTNKLYVCPDYEALSAVSHTSNYTYRYNALLGGFDAQRAILISPGTYQYVPWKIVQIRQSSNVVLFSEGVDVRATVNVNGLGLVTEGAQNRPANLYGHNPHAGIYLHGQRSGGTYFAYWNNSSNNPVLTGLTNVAFCDGSVQTVRYSLNAYPSPPFTPDSFIDPYHSGQTSW